MKKIVYIASAIILLSLVYLSVQYVLFSSQEASAIGIIGGADGPTAIFIASNTMSSTNVLLLGGLLTVIGIIIFKKR